MIEYREETNPFYSRIPKMHISTTFSRSKSLTHLSQPPVVWVTHSDFQGTEYGKGKITNLQWNNLENTPLAT